MRNPIWGSTVDALRVRNHLLCAWSKKKGKQLEKSKKRTRNEFYFTFVRFRGYRRSWINGASWNSQRRILLNLSWNNHCYVRLRDIYQWSKIIPIICYGREQNWLPFTPEQSREWYCHITNSCPSISSRSFAAVVEMQEKLCLGCWSKRDRYQRLLIRPMQTSWNRLIVSIDFTSFWNYNVKCVIQWRSFLCKYADDVLFRELPYCFPW